MLKFRAGHKAVVVAALLAAPFLMAGCGQGSASSDSGQGGTSSGPSTMEELVAAAKKESGSLTWYTATVDSANTALAADFKKKYGISLEIVRLATGPLLQRFASEEQSGKPLADILEPATPEVYTDHPEWFTDLTGLPGYDDFPDDYKGKKYLTVSVSPYTVTYNKNLVPESEVPKTWDDLVDPKWHGKVVLTDPRSSPSWMAWADLMDKSNGDGYLKKVAALDPAIVDSASSGAAKIAAGSAALSFPATAGNAAELIKQGAPLGVSEIEADTSGSNNFVSGVANSPHPASAALFLAYRMTQDAGKILCTAASNSAPQVKNGCPPIPSGYSPPNFKVSDADQNKYTKLLGLS